MNKFLLYLSIIIFVSFEKVMATEGACFFEEVYKNGEKQNGLLLISENNIRYEYFDPNLFTILYLNNDFYVIQNKNKTQSEKINDKRIALFLQLKDIMFDYPNVDERFDIEDTSINIEKSLNGFFPKRIGIKSNNFNLSIFLFNCELKPINHLFFRLNPIFDYPK